MRRNWFPIPRLVIMRAAESRACSWKSERAFYTTTLFTRVLFKCLEFRSSGNDLLIGGKKIIIVSLPRPVDEEENVIIIFFFFNESDVEMCTTVRLGKKKNVRTSPRKVTQLERETQLLSISMSPTNIRPSNSVPFIRYLVDSEDHKKVTRNLKIDMSLWSSPRVSKKFKMIKRNSLSAFTVRNIRF